jgi:plastocyanin
MSRWLVGLLVVTLVYGVSVFSRSLAADATGTITGRVVLTGEIPQAKKIKITKDQEKCGQEKTAEDLIVSAERGIKNAVVSVAGLKGPLAKTEANATIDQKGCAFSPHVLIAPAGAPVDIVNDDGILHNFHTISAKNAVINKAQPGFKKKMTETFSQAEIIKITCDAHGWMAAWLVVTDHPYIAATDATGAFKIANVPAGAQKIEIWHETLGKITKEVAVKAGEEAKLTIELSKK